MRQALVVSAAFALIGGGPALAADPVEGDWLTSTKRVNVRMARCPAAPANLCGKITWLKQATDDDGKPRRDDHNPDPARRADPLMGMMLVRDFTLAEPGRWTGGRIYDPNSGRTYNAKMKLQPDGTLKLDGCISILCISQTWTRPAP